MIASSVCAKTQSKPSETFRRKPRFWHKFPKDLAGPINLLDYRTRFSAAHGIVRDPQSRTVRDDEER